jgi:hypothetical protein
MVTHHRFNIQVACPSCEAPGKVEVVEDAGPPFTDTPRRAYASDALEFVLIAGSEPLEIECRACGAVFRRPS